MFVCVHRLVELNSRLVCGLGVGKFNELVTSSNPNDNPCRLVVLREIVETGHESNSLSQDISQWSVYTYTCTYMVSWSVGHQGCISQHWVQTDIFTASTFMLLGWVCSDKWSDLFLLIAQRMLLWQFWGQVGEICVPHFFHSSPLRPTNVLEDRNADVKILNGNDQSVYCTFCKHLVRFHAATPQSSSCTTGGIVSTWVS